MATPVFRNADKNRVVAVGPTASGRMLAVVLGPKPNEPGICSPFIVRPAGRKERWRYADARSGEQP